MYAVVFSRADEAKDHAAFSPLVEEQLGVEAGLTVPHNLDRALAPALFGLWYCLHLPSRLSDLVDVPAWALKAAQQAYMNAHHILLLPIDAFDRASYSTLVQGRQPALALCPDNLLDEAQQRAKSLGFALPATPYSALSDDTLRSHWQAIHRQFAPDTEALGNVPMLTQRLDLAPITLPYDRLARQMGWPDSQRGAADRNRDDLLPDTAYRQTVLAAVARLEREQTPRPVAEQRMPQVFKEEAARLRVPVTVALPGVAPAYSRRAYTSDLRRRIRALDVSDQNDTWTALMHQRPDAEVERSAIEFVTTHHAISTGGVGLTLPSMPAQAFTVLAELEKHFTSTRTAENPQSVRKLLHRLNDVAQQVWSESTIETIKRASKLTVFSNFPLGLLTLPGDTAPLSARVPIAYRPLLPLTRSVTWELATATQSFRLPHKIRVLVAECIPPSDPVGRISRIGWDSTGEVIQMAGDAISFERVEALNIETLRRTVAEHKPDFLVISAHGRLVGTAAALAIGEDDTCLSLGLDTAPPVVFLSACHTAPRGAGVVSVTDLLLREGVMAVLGTQVPVLVHRNAMLMGRLLVNLAEELTRRGGSRHATLLDLWHHVQMSNTVNDILSGNPALYAWATSSGANTDPVITEFMTSRSVGRIRPAHVYEDTERVLGEMADDRGMGAKVRNWFRNPGYIPESLFYLFAGRPDLIHLQDLEGWRPASPVVPT
ncbi:CHAT domain-containing protein [Streptomyces sp. NPDC004065]|uniref:CHAT domain-containing protein n=1 Tax=Streptomyces sp. NPDC004065 TaxID=3364689 RepID=UPI00384CE502